MKENHQPLPKNTPRSHCQGEKELHQMDDSTQHGLSLPSLVYDKEVFSSEAKGIKELHLAFTKQLTLGQHKCCHFKSD